MVVFMGGRAVEIRTESFDLERGLRAKHHFIFSNRASAGLGLPELFGSRLRGKCAVRAGIRGDVGLSAWCRAIGMRQNVGGAVVVFL